MDVGGPCCAGQSNGAALLGTLEYFDWINGLIRMYMMTNDNKNNWKKMENMQKMNKMSNCHIKDLLKRTRRHSITPHSFENNWEAKKKNCIKKILN